MSRINDGYFGEEPWSYGSVERVKEHNPNISRKQMRILEYKSADIYNTNEDIRKSMNILE